MKDGSCILANDTDRTIISKSGTEQSRSFLYPTYIISFGFNVALFREGPPPHEHNSSKVGYHSCIYNLSDFYLALLMLLAILVLLPLLAVAFPKITTILVLMLSCFL